MSQSIDSILPFEDPSFAVTVIEETPSKPWSGEDFGISTTQLEQAYQQALAVSVGQTTLGPLVSEIPSDIELIDDAVGRHRRHTVVVTLAIVGLALGITSALVL